MTDICCLCWQTALSWAASLNHVESLVVLLEGGSDVDACCHIQYTPLIIAAECGYADVVLILLSHGANVFAKKDGYTALGWAGYQQVDDVCSTIEYNSMEYVWVQLEMPGQTIGNMLAEEEARRRDQMPGWDSTLIRQRVYAARC